MVIFYTQAVEIKRNDLWPTGTISSCYQRQMM